MTAGPAKQAFEVGRAFLTLEGRQVHYRIVGNGPPALFIHPSPADSSFNLDNMLAVADRFTCFAFDTPGFGLSDALTPDDITIADLAEATIVAMDALGLPPLPIFGTHTGAAIALELAVRHPDRVTGLLLDSVPIFSWEEAVPLLESRYFSPLVPDIMGGHFAATWTRFRDQYIWFPWCLRQAANLNCQDLGSPEDIHARAQMFYAAADRYQAGYRAAVLYGDSAVEAVGNLQLPAFFTATANDMLHPHLKRLPPLRPGQQIVEIGVDPKRKFALTRDSFERFGSPGPAPIIERTLQSTDAVFRQCFADSGRNFMVRYVGDLANPALLLLHDTPGSGLSLEPRMRELAARYFVIAPDIPGSGDSAPLAPDADMSAYAGAMWHLCDVLGLATIAIEGRGLGASLALEMAVSESARCSSLAIDGLLLPDSEQRRLLQARYAPPIAIEPDGAHWYRLWLRLRDALVYWPWFETKHSALRETPAAVDARALHASTVEVMKQHASYHHFIDAALRYDAAARLRQCPLLPTLIDGPLSAIAAAYREPLQSLFFEIEAKRVEGRQYDDRDRIYA